jgi:nucleoid-associated protein YgaU
MALAKATIVNQTRKEKFRVLFNPEEYSLNRDVNYAQLAVPGLSGPLLQFVQGNLQTLEMELFVDTYESHVSGSGRANAAGDDARVIVGRITDLMNIDPTIHAPPLLQFVWGSLTFDCVLARANQRYIMFSPSGVPVRARVQVTFNQFRNPDMEAKEVKRETADYTKTYTVMRGDTLSAIAGREYGSSRNWRAIAIANDVDNPLRLVPGTRLVIPRLPYRHVETDEVYQ